MPAADFAEIQPMVEKGESEGSVAVLGLLGQIAGEWRKRSFGAKPRIMQAT